MPISIVISFHSGGILNFVEDFVKNFWRMYVMKISAVICEYNPFHLGHRHQLAEMKTMGAVVAIMSGSFTQRGDAALLSKYERAEIAVHCGADLVLELPFPYSSASAEIFGAAGVAIADRLGCVDSLCFGSEGGDLSSLLAVSRRLCSAEYETALAAYLVEDPARAYRTASAAVYRELYGEAMPAGSNDILALSYLNALRKRDSSIVPVALRRVGETYNGEGSGFASATTIRRYIETDDFDAVQRSTPAETFSALIHAKKNGRLADTNRMFPYFAFLARTREMDTVYDVPADLVARMRRFGHEEKQMTEFLQACVTKTYSASRVRRSMLMTMMDVKGNDVGCVPYTTVLAANETGRAILSRCKKTATLPIITKPADFMKMDDAAQRAFSLAARADAVWELLCDCPREGGAMMREKPRMI